MKIRKEMMLESKELLERFHQALGDIIDGKEDTFMESLKSATPWVRLHSAFVQQLVDNTITGQLAPPKIERWEERAEVEMRFDSLMAHFTPN